MLQFSGITPHLYCYVNKWGMVEIRVIYQRTLWDIVTDFDVAARRTSTGQSYCDECTPRDIFVSREALWVTHSFEPLLAWTNEHLHASQWLCLFGVTEYYSYAELKPMEDVPARETAANFVYACPVVRGKQSVE